MTGAISARREKTAGCPPAPDAFLGRTGRGEAGIEGLAADTEKVPGIA